MIYNEVMKHLLIALMLATPVAAHEGFHQFPQTISGNTIDADAFVNNHVNHGQITCYGKPDCIYAYDVEARDLRMVVPVDVEPFFRFPYDRIVTVPE